MMLAAVSALGGTTAHAQTGSTNQPMSGLELDRKLVEQGSLPPSVLKIDAELAKVPPTSPRALQLMKQKLAVTQQHADGLREQQDTRTREQQERLRAVGALTRLSDRASEQQQPHAPEQEQRMCAVNNGQVGYLRPC